MSVEHVAKNIHIAMASLPEAELRTAKAHIGEASAEACDLPDDTQANLTAALQSLETAERLLDTGKDALASYRDEITGAASASYAVAMPLFTAKHNGLKDDYSEGDGGSENLCTDIALDIAMLLIRKGESPDILTIFGKADENGNRAMLVPKPYGGRVEWGKHVICKNAGVVLDPMLDKPLPMEAYLAAAFGQEVEIQDKLYL